MKLFYMEKLKNHPHNNYQNGEIRYVNEPLSSLEIKSLEDKYNGGSLFPLALREYLMIAGKESYVFDYSYDSVEEMNDMCRTILAENNSSSSRPYWVLGDIRGTGFEVIFLDEGDDPVMKNLMQFNHNKPFIHHRQTAYFDPNLLNLTLSELVNIRVENRNKNTPPSN